MRGMAYRGPWVRTRCTEPVKRPQQRDISEMDGEWKDLIRESYEVIIN